MANRTARHMTDRRLGLVLGSGGAKGIAHIVVLEALDELGLKPSVVAGASIGAVAGACYCAGMSGKELRAFLLQGIADPLGIMGDLAKCHVGGLGDLFSLLGNPVLLDAERVVATLLPRVVPKLFAQLEIPLRVVATDFYARSSVVFSQGPLQPAIAASMAIPGLFQPVLNKKRVLIDGGITNPLPFEVLQDTCDVVLAVDVNGAPNKGDRPGGDVPRPLDALFASVQIMAHALVAEKLSHRRPAILLRPSITRFRVLDFLKAQEILDAAGPLREQVKREIDRSLDASTK